MIQKPPSTLRLEFHQPGDVTPPKSLEGREGMWIPHMITGGAEVVIDLEGGRHQVEKEALGVFILWAWGDVRRVSGAGPGGMHLVQG